MLWIKIPPSEKWWKPKELKDPEEFDWLESTEHAIEKVKFLHNWLHEKQLIRQDEDLTYWNAIELFFFFVLFFLDLCIIKFQ